MSGATEFALGSSPALAESPPLLHAFFERTARRWPDLPAVDIPPAPGRPERRIVTYAELQKQAGRLARALHPLVQGEVIVAILLPRDSKLKPID